MIKTHLDGVLNAIERGVTNARLEGINSVIQWLKKSVRGYRNRDRFRTAIYFHLGGLDPYPDSLTFQTKPAGTAAHIEQVVRAWRKIDRSVEASDDELRDASSHVSTHIDDNCMA